VLERLNSVAFLYSLWFSLAEPTNDTPHKNRKAYRQTQQPQGFNELGTFGGFKRLRMFSGFRRLGILDPFNGNVLLCRSIGATRSRQRTARGTMMRTAESRISRMSKLRRILAGVISFPEVISWPEVLRSRGPRLLRKGGEALLVFCGVSGVSLPSSGIPLPVSGVSLPVQSSASWI
jgi:hypothetical protein